MTTTTDPLGILAGAGAIPLEIARAVTSRGRAVHLVRIGGRPDEDTGGFPHTDVKWGAIGRLIRAFEDAGCREVVIAGSVRRPDLTRISPDLGLVRWLPEILGLLRGGDDSVLRRVVGFFERRGFRVLGIADVAPDLLVGTGVLGRVAPSDEATESIRAGFRLVAGLADLDIGQAVVMRGARPIAIEGAEGTDRMLARLSQGGAVPPGAVLVKRPKPGQELRVDLPAIGSRTVEAVATAGLSGIGVEAARVIVADRAAMVAAADAAGLFVAGIPADESAPEHATTPPAYTAGLFTPLGRRTARGAGLADVVVGLNAVARLQAWGEAPTAVVIGGDAVAAAVGEDPAAVIARAGGLKPWGLPGRRGAAIVSGPPSAELIAAAGGAGLAGIVFLLPPDGTAVALADQIAVTGLFVLAPARTP